MPETRPCVYGIDLDSQTRCAHYHGPLDIVAIRMKCCGRYFGCKDCHGAMAGHALEAWPKAEWDRQAVLCGACGAELSIRQYLESAHTCPVCEAQFNPGCRKHSHFYFEVKAEPSRGS